MFFTGKPLQAVDAHRLGVFNRLVPAEKLEDEVRELAGQLAAQPKGLWRPPNAREPRAGVELRRSPRVRVLPARGASRQPRISGWSKPRSGKTLEKMKQVTSPPVGKGARSAGWGRRMGRRPLIDAVIVANRQDTHRPIWRSAQRRAPRRPRGDRAPRGLKRAHVKPGEVGGRHPRVR